MAIGHCLCIPKGQDWESGVHRADSETLWSPLRK